MKKHNLLKVVIITIVVAALLTWILPTNYYNNYGVLVSDEGRIQMGLFDLFQYIPMLLANFGDTAIYILVIGGFYGILYHIDAYRKLLDTIVKKFKHNEWIFLVTVMVLFAIMSSMAGMYLALLFLFPFVISIVLLMGYDKMTAAFTTLGSVVVGLIGTMFSYSNVEGIENVLTYLGASSFASSEIVLKIIILVLGLALLIFNVLSYAKKHHNKSKILVDLKAELASDQSSEISSVYVPEPVDKKAKSRVWPIVVILDIILIITILSMLSWATVFGQTFFADALKSIQTFELFGFPIFGKLLGSSVIAFGEWGLIQLSVLLLVFSVILAFIYGFSINDYFGQFVKGVKRAAKPAFYALIVYVILVIFNNHPVLITIIKPILELTKGFNVATMSIVSFLTSVVDTDLYYEGSNILVYICTQHITDSTLFPIIAVVWQAMHGLVLLIAPTSAILLATLSYLNISYGKWLKRIIVFFIELLVVLLIVTTVAYLII